MEIGKRVAFEADGPTTGEVIDKWDESHPDFGSDQGSLPIWRAPAVRIKEDETGLKFWRPTRDVKAL